MLGTQSLGLLRREEMGAVRGHQAQLPPIYLAGLGPVTQLAWHRAHSRSWWKGGAGALTPSRCASRQPLASPACLPVAAGLLLASDSSVPDGRVARHIGSVSVVAQSGSFWLNVDPRDFCSDPCSLTLHSSILNPKRPAISHCPRWSASPGGLLPPVWV